MASRAVATKLRIKSGQRVCVLGAPEGITDALGLPADIELSTALDGTYDVILAFAVRMADLRATVDALRAGLAPNGKLWVSYPKLEAARKRGMASDISRDTMWSVFREHGLEGVAMISVDELWSAMRFREAG